MYLNSVAIYCLQLNSQINALSYFNEIFSVLTHLLFTPQILLSYVFNSKQQKFQFFGNILKIDLWYNYLSNKEYWHLEFGLYLIWLTWKPNNMIQEIADNLSLVSQIV